MDELLEATVVVEHAERSIWRPCEIHCRFDRCNENRCQIGLTGDGRRSLHEPGDFVIARGDTIHRSERNGDRRTSVHILEKQIGTYGPTAMIVNRVP